MFCIKCVYIKRWRWPGMYVRPCSHVLFFSVSEKFFVNGANITLLFLRFMKAGVEIGIGYCSILKYSNRLFDALLLTLSNI